MYVYREYRIKQTSFLQQQFFSLIKQLVSSHWLRNTDCLVLTLMTHGNMREDSTLVEFHDGSVTKVENILRQFSNVDCPALFNKPKVFLFPFCR